MNVQCQILKLPNQRKALKNSSILHFTFCILIFFILPAGCTAPNDKESPAAKIEQLTQENKQFQEQIEQFDAENKQLKEQIQVLSGLPENVRLENLNTLDTVKIGKYTGFFDKDDDGKKEKLIVYIQPVDKQGDTIKVTGSANVQLWDLNKTDGRAMLGEWQVKPDEMKELWFATMLTINYRLTFDAAGLDENLREPLTVKLAFTDYMTGKVFTAQKVIKAP